MPLSTDPNSLKSKQDLVHELAHVWDFMDDGLANGSRGHPRPEFFIDAYGQYKGAFKFSPTSMWYCWAAYEKMRAHDDPQTNLVVIDNPPTDRNRAEWYACMVVNTGSPY
jgi:hypothetical protein